MASALRDSGLAVFAVELPGHDLAAEREPFAPLAQVVDQVVDEITARDLPRFLLGALRPAPRSRWTRPGSSKTAVSRCSVFPWRATAR